MANAAEDFRTAQKPNGPVKFCVTEMSGAGLTVVVSLISIGLWAAIVSVI